MESESEGTEAEEEGEEGGARISWELETEEEAKGEASQKAKDWREKNMDDKAFLLDLDSLAGAPTNGKESNEAQEKTVPHSVAFEEDNEYVEQHLTSNNL